MHYWFQELGYEEGFDPGEVPHTKVRKRLISTYTIVSAVSWEERKWILGEDEVLEFFDMCGSTF